jgi:hypothetical protein
MYELIPILAGAGAGALVLRLGSVGLRAPLIGAVALATALVAGVAGGELEESWAFLLWDTAQAIAASVLIMIAWPSLARAR